MVFDLSRQQRGEWSSLTTAHGPCPTHQKRQYKNKTGQAATMQAVGVCRCRTNSGKISNSLWGSSLLRGQKEEPHQKLGGDKELLWYSQHVAGAQVRWIWSCSLQASISCVVRRIHSCLARPRSAVQQGVDFMAVWTV